ncbi:hypothetical protein GCM10020229_21290 [Kitasatospora albolonga]
MGWLTSNGPRHHGLHAGDPVVEQALAQTPCPTMPVAAAKSSTFTGFSVPSQVWAPSLPGPRPGARRRGRRAGNQVAAASPTGHRAGR